MPRETTGERLSKVEGIVGEQSNRIGLLEQDMRKVKESTEIVTRLDERTMNILNSQDKQSNKLDRLIFWLLTTGVGFCVSVIAAAIILKKMKGPYTYYLWPLTEGEP